MTGHFSTRTVKPHLGKHVRAPKQRLIPDHHVLLSFGVAMALRSAKRAVDKKENRRERSEARGPLSSSSETRDDNRVKMRDKGCPRRKADGVNRCRGDRRVTTSFVCRRFNDETVATRAERPRVPSPRRREPPIEMPPATCTVARARRVPGSGPTARDQSISVKNDANGRPG